MSDKSLKLSIPVSQEVCGYVIKKQPLGQYLKAIDLIKEMPMSLMNTIFPGQSGTDILTQITSINADMLVDILQNALIVLPDYVIKVVAQLTNIPYETLIEDENVGLDGLAQLWTAFWEVNKIEDFIKLLKKALVPLKGSLGKIPVMQQMSGSKT